MPDRVTGTARRSWPGRDRQDGRRTPTGPLDGARDGQAVGRRTWAVDTPRAVGWRRPGRRAVVGDGGASRACSGPAGLSYGLGVRRRSRMTGQAVTPLFNPSVVVGRRRPLPLSLAVRMAVRPACADHLIRRSKRGGWPCRSPRRRLGAGVPGTAQRCAPLGSSWGHLTLAQHHGSGILARVAPAIRRPPVTAGQWPVLMTIVDRRSPSIAARSGTQRARTVSALRVCPHHDRPRQRVRCCPILTP